MTRHFLTNSRNRFLFLLLVLAFQVRHVFGGRVDVVTEPIHTSGLQLRIALHIGLGFHCLLQEPKAIRENAWFPRRWIGLVADHAI